MKAMILAAGFGTRLKPLTNTIPKALVPFGNEPMINYQIRKLINLGFDELVVNAHHFAEQITEYFKKNSFGIKINVIEEENILGTGGGVLNAKEYLEKEDFFLVLNVDVYTDFDFNEIISFHKSYNPLATIAVQKRKTKRHLEFDDNMRLLHRENENSKKENLYAFNGVHIISNNIFALPSRSLVTSGNKKIEYIDIFDLYIELMSSGNKVIGFDVQDCNFKDLGKEDSIYS